MNHGMASEFAEENPMPYGANHREPLPPIVVAALEVACAEKYPLPDIGSYRVRGYDEQGHPVWQKYGKETHGV